MKKIALTTLIIGAAGLAGNIELGKSIVAPAIMVVASVAAIAYSIYREEREYEETHITYKHSDNDASYPSCLRRRA